MGDAIGVGIVGLSATEGFAARAHVPALAAVDGLELRALAASTPSSARRAGDVHGVDLVFDTADALATCDAVDLVVITVKVPMHHELVTAALAAGKPVFCEWPLGNGLAEAEALARAAAGVRTFVGLQGRSAPVVRYVRDLVADGQVGEVLSTTLVGSAEQWGATVFARREYLLDRANGATLLTIPFGHTIDAVTMVLGEVVELSATTATRRTDVPNPETGRTVRMTAEDQIAVTATLAGGAVLSAHYRGATAGTGFLWEVHGTDGSLRVTGATGHLQHGDVRIAVARGDEPFTELALPDGYDEFPSLARTPAHAVAHAYRRIRDDLTDGTTVVPDFTHAVRRHRLLDAIQRAAESGQRQTLEDT